MSTFWGNLSAKTFIKPYILMATRSGANSLLTGCPKLLFTWLPPVKPRRSVPAGDFDNSNWFDKPNNIAHLWNNAFLRIKGTDVTNPLHISSPKNIVGTTGGGNTPMKRKKRSVISGVYKTVNFTLDQLIPLLDTKADEEPKFWFLFF